MFESFDKLYVGLSSVFCVVGIIYVIISILVLLTDIRSIYLGGFLAIASIAGFLFEKNSTGGYVMNEESVPIFIFNPDCVFWGFVLALFITGVIKKNFMK